jgi:hypothetical protein
MKKYLMVVLAGMLIGLGAGISPVQADDYDFSKPRNLQVIWTTDHEAGIAWNPKAGAKYYTYRASPRRDFKQDGQMVRFIVKGDNIGVVTSLMANKKYYFQVAVSNFKGQKRSPWSDTKVGYTKAEGEY